MHQSAFKGNPHRSRRILFWWHLFSVNVFDDSSHKLPPHHYYVLIILTSCLFVCFFMSLEIETEFVERYYTAVGVSEKNIRVMACALVNPIRSSKKKVFDPFRGISLVLKKKKNKQKKKLQIASRSAFGVHPQSQVPSHSAAGWCVKVDWLTWRSDRRLPDMKGGVNPLGLVKEWKSSLQPFPFFSFSFFVAFFDLFTPPFRGNGLHHSGCPKRSSLKMSRPSKKSHTNVFKRCWELYRNCYIFRLCWTNWANCVGI